MTSKERVIKAINFDYPDRIPIWLFNKDEDEGDILWYDFRVYEDELLPGNNGNVISEWGYKWIRSGDGTMGQPEKPVLPSWEDVEKYQLPGLNVDKRLSGFKDFEKKARGYYTMPLLVITGFTTYCFLRGFENAMIDFIEEPDKAKYLLGKLFSFERELMTLAAEVGFDGFHLGDDWGTQENLLISPDIWREIFKPMYKAHIDHAHALGLHIWFHSCGNLTSIVDDMYEIGLDVMNIAQPNVVNIQKIGQQLKGKQCFLLPISYQTESISGTPQQIMEEGKRLYEQLGVQSGGFIGYVQEYSCMGMTEENYKACIDAFKSL